MVNLLIIGKLICIMMFEFCGKGNRIIVGIGRYMDKDIGYYIV